MSPTITNHTPATNARAQRAAAMGIGPGNHGPISKTREPENNSGTSLDTIQRKLEQLTTGGGNPSNVFRQFVQLTGISTNAIWSGLFQTNEMAGSNQNQLNCLVEHNSVAEQNLAVAKSSLLPTAESALQQATAKVDRSGELTVIAVPVFVKQHGGDKREISKAEQCLSVALNLKNQPVEPFMLIVQMVSVYLSRWHERQAVSQLDWQIDATAAIAELMSEVAGAKKSRQSAMLATNKLAGFLNARTVAIGLTSHEGSKRTRLVSISGATKIDAGGTTSRQLQAALNETMIRDSVTTLPTLSGDDRSMKIAHKKLLELNPETVLVSSPLTTTCGKTIGAWICLLPDNESNHHRATRFAKTVGTYLADAMNLSNRAAAGPATRLKTDIIEFVRGRAGKVAIGAALLVAMIMLIPIPHRIDCHCSLQPTVRRFAVAPHDGILLESDVKPGDIVTAGQVVARMDDRELRLEMSDLIAKRDSAIKKRDVNRSSRDAAATQISEFEIKQLDAKISLIRFKQKNLEIRSAIDGIVLQGDLEDAKGAPVRIGDVLMEIAPLDSLKLEMDVAEADIAYVEVGQTATIVLDGNPFEAIEGEVALVKPMSEVRDSQNVFVSEMKIENRDRTLRPGMQGRAKIAGGQRALGWILFHRPCERVYSIFR